MNFKRSDYKDVIRDSLNENGGVRGYQAQLAQAAGCGSSYFSQVMNTHVHLTPDQAAGLASFWNLSEDATEYFISLVHLARTNSSAYKNYLERKIRELRERHSDISKRVQSEKVTLAGDALQYYSAWFWIAIHVATSVPRYQTASALAKRFALSETQVEEVLATLQKLGVVERKGGGWHALNRSFHLEKQSPLIGIHHTNWRQRALADAVGGHKDSLHYSVVHSLSVEDFETLKSMLLDFISRSRKIVESSPEQEVVAVCLDCFRV